MMERKGWIGNTYCQTFYNNKFISIVNVMTTKHTFRGRTQNISK